MPEWLFELFNPWTTPAALVLTVTLADARTLRLWRDQFTAKLDHVRALGFDDRFIRKWTYYLCYCEAAFALRNISVVHTLHTRANNLAF